MIKFAEITGIEVEQYHGEVYNLETEHEEYVVEGIVAHNCPHFWSNNPDQVPQEDCVLLWMGMG